MYLHVPTSVVLEAVEELSDTELSVYGITRIKEGQVVTDAPPCAGFGHETPIPEQIRVAAVRGDLPAFIEYTRQLLDERDDVFVRTDRLLANVREGATA